MKITNFSELESVISMYRLSRYRTGKKEALNTIRETIKSNLDFRSKLKEKLKKTHHVYYIKFFDIDGQVEIIEEILQEMKENQDLAQDANMLLLFASKETVKKVLSSADKSAIREIIKITKKEIKLSGVKRKVQLIKLYLLCSKEI